MGHRMSSMIVRGPRIRALVPGVFLLLMAACGTGLRTPLGEIYWTQFKQQRQMARDEAAARYNYCPEGGCLIRLEDIEVRPAVSRRGDTLAVTTTYTLLTAQELAVPVTISRELFFAGKSLGRIKEISTTQGNGTWNQQVHFALPASAAPGTYTLVTRISTPYGSDRKSTQFTAN